MLLNYVVKFAEWCREGGVHDEKHGWKLHLRMGPPLLPWHHCLVLHLLFFSFSFLFFFLSLFNVLVVYGPHTSVGLFEERFVSDDCLIVHV